MRKPYKVMVWGPGKLGSICIWEMIQSSAFEIVGVRAYSDAKNGVDIGEFIGVEPMGLAMSSDVDALLETDCDCIVYTAHDIGDYGTDDEILKLLAAGKNVVTPLPYQNAHLFREAEFVDKLKAACEKGGSVFHASGIDPDLMSDRVLMGLTGLCTDVEYIKLQEYWDCSASVPASLDLVGFGKTPEDAAKQPLTGNIAANFLRAIAYTAEEILGVKFDRVEEHHDFMPSSQDIDTTIFVKKDTVGRVAHRIEGYVDAKGDHPFFTIEYNWLIDNVMLPEDVKPGQYYIMTIEGRPSVRVAVDLKTSHKNDDRYYQLGNIKSEPSYHGTIAPCIQAIPHMCEAEPGILPSFGPGLHWMQDLRDSVRQKQAK